LSPSTSSIATGSSQEAIHELPVAILLVEGVKLEVDIYNSTAASVTHEVVLKGARLEAGAAGA